MPLSHSKHAVLFGGAGFIGSHLINALSRGGWTMTVVTKHPHRHRSLLVIPSLKMVETGDLSSDYIGSLISESDTVVNLIGILNQSRIDTFAEIHASLPGRIAEACLQRKARRLVNISALGSDVNAPSQYLKSRAQGEQAVQSVIEKGLECTIIRPSIVFGPGDSFSRMFHQMLSMSPVLFPLILPKVRVQPVYVGDVVRCIAHAIDVKFTDQGKFDVAGPEIFTLREFVSLVDRFGGMSHKIVGLSPGLSKLLASFAQFAPGKPLTPDNLRSLQASVAIGEGMPEPYGVQPTRFESVAGEWLSPQIDKFDQFRTQAGR
ncbi:MAG: complex I NDUFA9 subunit family protein [Gammaproteobacteria bacterium]|nr:complex I NDUFA9 subunit family protein [Gammaproteobacteria bacterium]